jgi:hypothetical protein
MEQEIPEVREGTVEIKAISREPGARSKAAVFATVPGVDPVGSCVGMRGLRIQNIVNELGGEKIDVVEWNADPIEPSMMHSVRIARASHVAFASAISSSSESGGVTPSLLSKKLNTAAKSEVLAGIVMLRVVTAPGTGLNGAEARNQTGPDCGESAVPPACAHCQ